MSVYTNSCIAKWEMSENESLFYTLRNDQQWPTTGQTKLKQQYIIIKKKKNNTNEKSEL